MYSPPGTSVVGVVRDPVWSSRVEGHVGFVQTPAGREPLLKIPLKGLVLIPWVSFGLFFSVP